MILYSCNNYVEYFIIKEVVKNKNNIQIKDKDILFLISKGVYNKLEKDEKNKHNYYVIDLYFSKNPLHFFLLCFRYYLSLMHIKRKYKIKKIFSFGHMTGNSLFLQSFFKDVETIFLTLRDQNRINNKKLDIFASLSMSLSYLFFIQKIALIYFTKANKSSKTFSEIKILPFNKKPTIIDLNVEKKINEKIDRIIIVGERLDYKKTPFSEKEENNYLSFINTLQSKCLPKNIDIYYFARLGFTEKYHDFLINIGIKILIKDEEPFEKYLSSMKSVPLIIGVKSTCLVTAKIFGFQSISIGQIIKLNKDNMSHVDLFLNSFGSAAPKKASNKDEIYQFIN